MGLITFPRGCLTCVRQPLFCIFCLNSEEKSSILMFSARIMRENKRHSVLGDTKEDFDKEKITASPNITTMEVTSKPTKEPTATPTKRPKKSKKPIATKQAVIKNPVVTSALVVTPSPTRVPEMTKKPEKIKKPKEDSQIIIDDSNVTVE